MEYNRESHVHHFNNFLSNVKDFPEKNPKIKGMNWLMQLLKVPLKKEAGWGDLQFSFGPGNINSLKKLIQNILSQQTVDRNKQMWFNELKNSPSTAQVLQNNGNTLISARAIEDTLFNLSSLSPTEPEVFRLKSELNRKAQERQQQQQNQTQQRHSQNLKVTSFRLLQATSDYYLYALSWTSPLPDKPMAYLWQGIDATGNPKNLIRDQIQQLGVHLEKDKTLSKEWLVTGLTPALIPSLKQVFVNNNYDISIKCCIPKNTNGCNEII